jgi:hypothetical protein
MTTGTVTRLQCCRVHLRKGSTHVKHTCLNRCPYRSLACSCLLGLSFFFPSFIHQNLKAVHGNQKSSVRYQSQHLRAHRLKTICMGSNSAHALRPELESYCTQHDRLLNQVSNQPHCQLFNQLCHRGLPENIPSTMVARLGALERLGRHQTVQMIHVVFSNLHQTRENSGQRYASKLVPGSEPPQD